MLDHQRIAICLVDRHEVVARTGISLALPSLDSRFPFRIDSLASVIDWIIADRFVLTT